MIGQEKLLEVIDKCAKLPRFIILVGEKGSGRHLVAQHIAKKLSAPLIVSDIGVDAIRALIPTAYRVTSNTVYLLPDVENMSPSARNALLKVTEEPPQNAYFIMTVTDTSFVLPTLRSRGTILYMFPYTSMEIIDFAKQQGYSDEEVYMASHICSVPGDVLTLHEYGVDEFVKYVNLVFENIDKASTANVFKIGNKIKLKDTDEGYDLRLFFRAFVKLCGDNFNQKKYITWVQITSKILKDLKITGLNLSHTFDVWVLAIRGWETWTPLL